MSFTDKVVIVAGSNSNIELSVAIKFVTEGAKVILAGTNDVVLEKFTEKCKSFGKNILALKIDITKDEQASYLINKVYNHFGKLNILVTDLNESEDADILNNDFMDKYDQTIKVNLRSAVCLTHLALPYLIKSKGNIVHVSSIEARMNITKGAIPYGTSKSALDRFSYGVAAKLVPLGVRVNIVSPGHVKADEVINSSDKNEQTLTKRMNDPGEIGDLILFVASDKAKGITGSDFVIDNGTLLNN
ncbi:7alpha-hydroxysteroid dehydrogenase-like [Battus philenor]|uniref:7alpha-hydroxysteroid dehydrogenase-like n=1 Tax=Battus philenor TaxID=42288 RepID=UPI0035CFB221